MLIFVYKMLPVFIKMKKFEEDEKILAAYTNGFFIYYNSQEKLRDDILAHEIEHVKEWYKKTFLYALLFFILFSIIILPNTIYLTVCILFNSIIYGHIIDKFLWITSKKYRLKGEVKAYKVQARYFKDEEGIKKYFASKLVEMYGFNNDIEEIFNMLMEK